MMKTIVQFEVDPTDIDVYAYVHMIMTSRLDQAYVDTCLDKMQYLLETLFENIHEEWQQKRLNDILDSEYLHGLTLVEADNA